MCTSARSVIKRLLLKPELCPLNLIYKLTLKFLSIQAYKNKMYGRKYVWLIPGTMNPGWYTNLRSFKDCTSDQLLEAAEGYFVVTRLDLRTDGKSSFSGLVSFSQCKISKIFVSERHQSIPVNAVSQHLQENCQCCMSSSCWQRFKSPAFLF